MGYKTILVHLHDERRASRLLDAAVGLALKHEAHLIGIDVCPLPLIFANVLEGGAEDLIELERKERRESAQRLEALFKTATTVLKRPAEWRIVEAMHTTAAETVIAHGRTTDLIIASQSDPDWYQSSALEAPERLAIEAGRPVLLIPNRGQHQTNGRHIMIAWNERREAARAVFDALPLLAAAEKVDVLQVNPEANGLTTQDQPRADICGALALHGIKCTSIQASAPHADAGGEILRQARVLDADLLVMGAYGHSRAREFMLGGVSRHVLRHMTLPVLMSH